MAYKVSQFTTNHLVMKTVLFALWASIAVGTTVLITTSTSSCTKIEDKSEIMATTDFSSSDKGAEDRMSTYYSIPAVGTFPSNLVGALVGSCGTFHGGNIRAKVTAISASQITVEISKIGGSSFSKNGTAYIKAASVCGGVAGSATYTATATTVNVTFNATFASGLVTFFPEVISSSGDRYFATPIMVYTSWLAASQPYGTAFGTVNGVTVYSNGASPSYASNSYNTVGTINTGMKWQCVEFVNRYYLQVYGMNIRIAGTDAWQYYGTASQRGLVAYANNGNIAPQVGDLLCISGNTYGHVAIVTEVGANYIKVAQQNVGNGAHIQFSFSKSGNNVNATNLGAGYTVQGWLRKP
jgi:surface antigen